MCPVSPLKYSGKYSSDYLPNPSSASGPSASRSAASSTIHPSSNPTPITSPPQTLFSLQLQQVLPFFLLPLESLNFNCDSPQTIDAIHVKQLQRSGVPRLGHLPVSSCNGLILISDDECFFECLKDDFLETWAIWNLLTRECHRLPHYNDGSFLVAKGLGYDCAADDYKVVRIHCQFGPESVVFKTLVYSVRLGCWRTVDQNCPSVICGRNEGVYLRGALHWLSRDSIIALDIGTADYSLLPIPPLMGGLKCCGVHLDALGGCLTMSYAYNDFEQQFDVWVMNDYGVDKPWTKFFSLEDLDMFISVSELRPVAYLKGEKQVLMQKQLDRSFLALDVEDKSMKKVAIHGHFGYSSAQICPGTIFRLGDRGSGAAKRTSRMKRKSKSKNKSKGFSSRLTFCIRDVDHWYCSDSSCHTPSSESEDY